MRIILFVISFILLAEAGVASFFIKGNNIYHVIAIEGAAEEEFPLEKDSFKNDKQITEKHYYNNSSGKFKNDFKLEEKNNLPFISHTIFSPPPDC